MVSQEDHLGGWLTWMLTWELPWLKKSLQPMGLPSSLHRMNLLICLAIPLSNPGLVGDLYVSGVATEGQSCNLCRFCCSGVTEALHTTCWFAEDSLVLEMTNLGHVSKPEALHHHNRAMNEPSANHLLTTI